MRCQLLLADESYRLGGLLQVNPDSSNLLSAAVMA
jgi:hypothetical protein